jgi:hypothetical protein
MSVSFTCKALIGILFCGPFTVKQLNGSPVSCSKLSNLKLHISYVQPYCTYTLSNKKTDSVTVRNDFSSLGKYLGSNCSYPFSARKSHLTGRVIIGFDINENQEIANANVTEDDSPSTVFANEVLNRFKKFKGRVKAAPGSYTYQVLFRFDGEDRSADKALDYKKHAGTVLIFAL